MRKLAQFRMPEGNPELKKREPKAEPPRGKKARILIVDDDQDIRTMLSSMLEEYHVGIAEDGAQGLELFKSGGFDVVVTDMKMPKMNGMELLAEIMVMNPGAKVIVISGFMDEATKSILKEMGAAAILEKPMGVVEIEDHVARILLN